MTDVPRTARSELCECCPTNKVVADEDEKMSKPREAPQSLSAKRQIKRRLSEDSAAFLSHYFHRLYCSNGVLDKYDANLYAGYCRRISVRGTEVKNILVPRNTLVFGYGKVPCRPPVILTKWSVYSGLQRMSQMRNAEYSHSYSVTFFDPSP